ncbi:winged helix-turn-helix domain-containing protein [Desulfovibrio sp. JC010]|uniref:winged helix-turn-helix domain-containing protein n=1 Tax=Desulfovibrio sp. JC010 TaxID=2593641 RepID=UPI0013D5A95B|nr:winged helix-turn-helix domain-containing protein [Desulfovibrio sp. JC010]NDV27152.1 winged helix-turn-helix transcriptional regulator [Desulfovibrio sp. JC010]
MLKELFTSKTRIKLLLKLFLNPDVSSYLRELAAEFDVSPNAMKEELDGLSEAGYLNKKKEGRYIYYNANSTHPFFPEISSIVRKYIGIDRVLEYILSTIGDVDSVYVLDDYAKGIDSGIIDVLIIGDETDSERIVELCNKAEEAIQRKIRIMVLNRTEFEKTSDIYLRRPNWKVI